MLNKIFLAIKYLSLNTIRFNFYYFPLKVAIKLPVLVSKNVHLKKIKGNVRLEGKISTGMVKIGFGDVGIFDKKVSRTIWSVEGNIIFESYTNIGHGSKISVGKSGILKCGKSFTITSSSTIIANRFIQFGNDCLLSWDILIMDDDFHIIRNKEGHWINEPKEILIGNKIWIGCGCKILKGSIIKDNSIIAAGSLVSKELKEENSIYGGNPLRIVKGEINWEK